MTILATDITANGTESGAISGGAKRGLIVKGVFDTASVQIDYSFDEGTTWVAAGSALTAAGMYTLDLPGDFKQYKVRAVVSSVGGSTDLVFEAV